MNNDLITSVLYKRYTYFTYRVSEKSKKKSLKKASLLLTSLYLCLIFIIFMYAWLVTANRVTMLLRGR